MKTNLVIFLSLLTLLFSCKKDEATPETPVIPELGSISGKFGSESFYFTAPFYTSEGMADTMSNVYYTYGFFGMHRNDAKLATKGISLYIQCTGMESLPLNQPVPFCEVQLNNYLCPNDTVFGPRDSCNYIGSSLDQSVEMIITDKTDDVLTGTFSGVIRTRTGLTKQVTDGKFRIRLIRKTALVK